MQVVYIAAFWRTFILELEKINKKQKKFLIFRGMELSCSNIKKILIFLEMELFNSNVKKFQETETLKRKL